MISEGRLVELHQLYASFKTDTNLSHIKELIAEIRALRKIKDAAKIVLAHPLISTTFDPIYGHGQSQGSLWRLWRDVYESITDYESSEAKRNE